jgi:hypothetical protein
MDTEISETSGFDSILTLLIAQEDFSTVKGLVHMNKKTKFRISNDKCHKLAMKELFVAVY